MIRLQVRQLFLTLESHLSFSALQLHNEFLKYSCLGDSLHPEIQILSIWGGTKSCLLFTLPSNSDSHKGQKMTELQAIWTLMKQSLHKKEASTMGKCDDWLSHRSWINSLVPMAIVCIQATVPQIWVYGYWGKGCEYILTRKCLPIRNSVHVARLSPRLCQAPPPSPQPPFLALQSTYHMM